MMDVGCDGDAEERRGMRMMLPSRLPHAVLVRGAVCARAASCRPVLCPVSHLDRDPEGT